jgi:Tol biopolymer transport system component
MHLTTRSALVAAAAVAAFAAAAPAAHAAFPGTNGPILFPVKAQTPYHLWSMPLDGTAGALSTLDGNAQFVDTSPDGKRIVFDHWEPGIGSGIYVADADGANARRITPVTENSEEHPGWSADGKTIVFTTVDDERDQRVLMLMDHTGANRRALGDGVPAQEAVFSPDGTRIAYFVDTDELETRTARGRFEPYAIFTANRDGSDRTFVAYGRDVEWTPDGRSLVYSWWSGSGAGDQTLWRIDAGDPAAQPQEIGGGWEFDDLLDPSVSPDGKQVVFEGRWTTSSTLEDPPWTGVGVMNLDGTGARRLSAGRGGESPEWAVGEPVDPDEEPKDDRSAGGAQRTATQQQQDQRATPGVVTPKPPAVTARRCISRRRFAIRVRGRGVRTATITVNGKPAKVARRGGRLGASVDLRTLPRGRFTVTVRKTMADGTTRTEVRRYRTCTPKRTRGA